MVYNKLSDSKFFFKEEDFQEEVNNLLMMMNSTIKIEPHSITQGVCVKTNLTPFRAIDFKENDFKAFFEEFLKKFHNFNGFIKKKKISFKKEKFGKNNGKSSSFIGK